MAPKKKPSQQQQQNTKKKSSSNSSSTAPKLQISAENEQRLRRLLLNNSSSRPSPPSISATDNTISKSQKAKRLRTIYDKLSLQGFTSIQIEQSLSSLNEGGTFEDALDWLCLNLPGNELPLKFSSGTSLNDEGGSISIISTAREDWVPSSDPSAEDEKNMLEVPFQIKERVNDDTMDMRQPSQADWIKQYVEQQEEDEWETLESDVNGGSQEVFDLSKRADSIVKEYHIARLEAMSAKERRDKKSQEIAGNKIRKLKQEMSDLGLSEDILASGFEDECASCCPSKDVGSASDACKGTEIQSSHDTGSGLNLIDVEMESVDNAPSIAPFEGSNVVEEEKEEVDPDVELGLFFEDASASETLPSEVLKLQKKEKLAQLSEVLTLEKIDGIWKKGDARRIPKAVLQQMCQRLGWGAPKFTKLPSKGEGFSYTVSIIRKASGRGKNKKAGGLITLELPDLNGTFESAEDAQNKVAAYALHRLFTEYPVYQLITEPYSSYVMSWMEGESPIGVEDGEETRRSSFVDSLLSAGYSESTTSSYVEKPVKDQASEIAGSVSTATKVKRNNNFQQLDSTNLKREHEHKLGRQKYKEMLDARAALPIAGLKGEILQLLKENDVLVVCGETGCGKTTQVPQFILDDMIEAGLGGYSNIVCTQPRRIAAISVAERVADERCEPPPGSDGSLVGFQVRLDSARHERTKLLFCTTGILLRKLAGDKNLDDVTHVIVDEVHERSLLGDFLLVILKNLIEKQSARNARKLKVILMSATVDSSLFSRYFGNCPVLTAQGRTHPVSSYFLEDIYESLEYCLASDCPASLRHMTPTKEKLRSNTVDNHRGKKNLVLSSWGDDSQLYESYVNPNYDASAYVSYSERTRENLKDLNEDVIDYDLLEDLVCHIDETQPAGAILIFLPGVAEIYMLHDRLLASYQFRGNSSEWLLPLHSSLASIDQKKVFLSPPENTRKVIIATDIAETSITIDDVIYVIDCGKHKEQRYNPQKKLSSMVEDWISRANARQRRGRAGRVKPGICFCLYTRHRFENLMRPYQAPEILRMPLMELCLQVKSLSLGYIKSFLMKAIEPPREEAMTSALSTLYEVGAIEGDEELTPLGYHLAKLPVDVLIGKMMIYGGIFCCLSPILSISACLSYKSPFTYPKEERQRVELTKQTLLTDKVDGLSCSNQGDMQSDHIVMVVAYNKWARILREQGVKAAQNFCGSHFLSSSVMYMIRDMRIQFGSLLADIGIINLPKALQTGKMKDKLDQWFSDMTQPFNKYSHHSSIVKSILCAGLYPNVAATEEGILDVASTKNLKLASRPTTAKGHPLWFDRRREVFIHPSSINSQVKTFQYPFLAYLEKVETNKVFLRDTSIISPYSILLFGGSINILHQTGQVTIDGWLKLNAPAQTAVLFKELRLTLHSVLKELIRNPEKAAVENEIIRSLVHLLLEEDKPQ
ncbi:RNA helicase [Ranunculus cassubicifolius]